MLPSRKAIPLSCVKHFVIFHETGGAILVKDRKPEDGSHINRPLFQ